jgi:hypothetical protein
MCGGNGQDCGGIEINHTVGRESNSPLNGSPLCKKCHAHVGHADAEQAELLQKTLRYLLRKGYELTTNDLQFYQKYERLYGKQLDS